MCEKCGIILQPAATRPVILASFLLAQSLDTLVAHQLWRRRGTAGGERVEGGLQVSRVPQDDGRDHQVQPGRPVGLVLESAVAQLAQAMGEHGPRQRVARGGARPDRTLSITSCRRTGAQPKVPAIKDSNLVVSRRTVGLVAKGSTIGSVCTQAWVTAPRPRHGPAWRRLPCAPPHDALISRLHTSGGKPTTGKARSDCARAGHWSGNCRSRQAVQTPTASVCRTYLGRSKCSRFET
jgi:hypothetical protein